MRGELLRRAGNHRCRRGEPAPRHRRAPSRSRRSPSSCARRRVSRGCCWPHGRRDDARAVLAPIFAWFTEGHSDEGSRRRANGPCRDRIVTESGTHHCRSSGCSRRSMRSCTRRRTSRPPCRGGRADARGRRRRHARAGHSALCLSGGGVRSGSFGLGVLQGLARAGVLGQVRLPVDGVRRRLHRWMAHCVAPARARTRRGRPARAARARTSSPSRSRASAA